MSHAAIENQTEEVESAHSDRPIRQSTVDAGSVPLEQIDMSDPELYETNTHRPTSSGCGRKIPFTIATAN